MPCLSSMMSTGELRNLEFKATLIWYFSWEARWSSVTSSSFEVPRITLRKTAQLTSSSSKRGSRIRVKQSIIYLFPIGCSLTLSKFSFEFSTSARWSTHLPPRIPRQHSRTHWNFSRWPSSSGTRRFKKMWLSMVWCPYLPLREQWQSCPFSRAKNVEDSISSLRPSLRTSAVS